MCWHWETQIDNLWLSSPRPGTRWIKLQPASPTFHWSQWQFTFLVVNEHYPDKLQCEMPWPEQLISRVQSLTCIFPLTDNQPLQNTHTHTSTSGLQLQNELFLNHLKFRNEDVCFTDYKVMLVAGMLSALFRKINQYSSSLHNNVVQPKSIVTFAQPLHRYKLAFTWQGQAHGARHPSWAHVLQLSLPAKTTSPVICILWLVRVLQSFLPCSLLYVQYYWLSSTRHAWLQLHFYMLLTVSFSPQQTSLNLYSLPSSYTLPFLQSYNTWLQNCANQQSGS